jgi:hypothetical protein
MTFYINPVNLLIQIINRIKEMIIFLISYVGCFIAKSKIQIKLLFKCKEKFYNIKSEGCGEKTIYKTDSF